MTPPLFNHAVVLQRLQRKNSSIGRNNNDDEKDGDKDKDREKGKENLLVKKWDLVEAQAQLYIVAKDHGEALNCYLGMHASHTGDNNEDEESENNAASGFDTGDMEGQDGSSSSGPSSAYGRVRKHMYRHVFELIEREVRRYDRIV